MPLDEIIRGAIAAHEIKSLGDTEYVLRKLIEDALKEMVTVVVHPRPNWRDCDERYD